MPSWESLPGWMAAIAASFLAGFVFWRERRQLAYAAFALGMLAVAAREVFGALALDADFVSQRLEWHRIRLVSQAAIPGFWLVFALTFARAEPRRFLYKWRWAIAAVFLVPPAIALLGFRSLVMRSYAMPTWLIPVGPGGQWLHAALLLASVLILVHLENTLRSAVGSVRWQIKFTILGVGLLFGVELFSHSQVLLYSQLITTSLLPFGSAAVLIACGFVVASLLWRRLGSFDVYISDEVIWNSITLLVVGFYLLVVAGFVQLIDVVAGRQRAPLIAFVVLLASLGLALTLLSTELQQRVKNFVNRHLRRPTHDYRRVWGEFTRRTSRLVEIGPLSTEICNLASDTFGCSSATLWLVKNGEKKLVLGGSSAISAAQAQEILATYAGGREWLSIMGSRIHEHLSLGSPGLPDAARDLPRVVQASHSIALLGNDDRPIGFLTINDRVAGPEYSAEDFALLKTFADQAAATLLNRQLTKELERAKEMETFQTLSTFFVHDLKNLASRLSLSMQNIPLHFDKPAFRDDLLRTIEKSVSKIETMTSRLSSLSKGRSLHRVACDLNALVRESLSGLNGTLKAGLVFECAELPAIVADPEEIQNVLTNLVLNAHEASGDSGHIMVKTSRENGWVLLTVADNGAGMTPEFIESSLFKPFQTTKKHGLGIGLFQSKTIVEAHGGRIEVSSAPGQGTTFRVLLPVRAQSLQ